MRFNRSIKIAGLLVCCCLGVCTQVIASEDRGFFWQLKSARAEVYLLGSIHYANDSFYPLRREIEQAFDASEHLVVEVDITQIDPASILSSDAMYPQGESIKDHISLETYNELLRRLQALGVQPEIISQQKPGMLVLTLTALQAMRLGLDPKHGIDLHFIQKAGAEKNIIELETIEQQLGIFFNLSQAEILLKESLQSMDDAEQLMKDMVRLWKTGDEKGLQHLMFEESIAAYPELASIHEELFYQRNRNMAQAITGYLQKGGRYFVVVGAGHLVGEQGIVGLLSEAGYSAIRR